MKSILCTYVCDPRLLIQTLICRLFISKTLLLLYSIVTLSFTRVLNVPKSLLFKDTGSKTSAILFACNFLSINACGFVIVRFGRWSITFWVAKISWQRFYLKTFCSFWLLEVGIFLRIGHGGVIREERDETRLQFCYISKFLQGIFLNGYRLNIFDVFFWVSSLRYGHLLLRQCLVFS